MKLKGKTAVITGGARGMGRSHGLALAKEGANIAAVDICRQVIEDEYRLSEKSVLDQTVEDIKKIGSGAMGVCCDVTKSNELQEMFKQVNEEFGSIDILVNNAGMATIATCEDMTEEEWDLVVDINLKGIFLCCKYALPYMKKQNSGKIVNISSIAARQPNAGAAHYGAAKMGVVSLTESYAVEFAPYNINVNAVAPGLVQTDFQGEIARVLGANLDESISKKIDLYHQFKRPVPVESISAAVIFLASEDAKDITGQTLYVDQGWTLARPKKS